MFCIARYLCQSLMFDGKTKSSTLEWSQIRSFNREGYWITLKHGVDKADRDKRTSLLGCSIIYCRKKFYGTSPRTVSCYAPYYSLQYKRTNTHTLFLTHSLAHTHNHIHTHTHTQSHTLPALYYLVHPLSLPHPLSVTLITVHLPHSLFHSHY